MSEEQRDKQSNPYLDSAFEAMPGFLSEKRRFAAATRKVIGLLVTSEAPEEELARAADRAEEFAELLDSYPHRDRFAGYGESSTAGDVSAFFDESPLIGLSNPLAPPLRLRKEGDLIRGEVVFGTAYQGPPGNVHGGYIAAAFDELLGFAQSLTGHPGMTGQLTVRYKKPTPLHKKLRLEAGVKKVEGRKILVWGTMSLEDGVSAEAEGLFISIDSERYRCMVEDTAKHQAAVAEAKQRKS